MPQTLYLMVGYPGAGKTTTAETIQQLTGAEHLWADAERNQRFVHPTHSQAESQELYDYLNQLTDRLLAEGKSVIYDTNFNFHKDRQKLRRIAQSHDAQTVVVWVQVPKELAQNRATEAEIKHASRVWGNMPLEDFERLSNHLQPPRADEHVIKIDGTKVTPEYIAERLHLA